MNKSFKVVFSKARSALMVVNEATSSIQAKGTKTVIAAAAAAMIAGGAVAAEPTRIDGNRITLVPAPRILCLAVKWTLPVSRSGFQAIPSMALLGLLVPILGNWK